LAKAVLLAGVIEVLTGSADHLCSGPGILVRIRNQLFIQDLFRVRALMLTLTANLGQLGIRHDVTPGN